MASAFQESIKGGVVDRLNIEREYRSYRKTFAKFDDVFGRERVRLWKFDPDAFPRGCAVRDFCSRLGIALPAERIVRLNESLSRQAVALLYTYRKLGESHGARTMKGPESQRLGRVLAAAGDDRFHFSPDLVRPVLEKNRADIEWIEARLGQSLDEGRAGQRAGAVRGEADLLNAAPETVARLLALLGDHRPAGVAGRTPQEVAALVHALRTKPAPDAPAAIRGGNPAGSKAGKLMLGAGE
jgi:hypothetical protein